MKHYLIAILLLILIAIPGGLAIASDITDALYYGTIAISNSSTANTTGLSVNMTSLSDTLIDNFGVTTAFDRVAVRNSTGADVKYMPGYGVSPWMFWVPTIGENSNINYTIYVGESDLVSTKFYFPGSDNLTVSDAASLEPAASVNISLTGYINPEVGGDTYLVWHADTINGGFGIVNPISGNITARILGAGLVWTASASTNTSTSGEYNVSVTYNGTHLCLYTGGTLVATTAYSGSIPNSFSDWAIGNINLTPYILSCNITVGGVLKGSWKWNYGATFPDDSGNGNTATPSYRATSSDADVSANLTSFSPIAPAVSTVSTNATWPQMVTDVPDEPATLYSENTSPGFFFASIFNVGLDAGGIPRAFFWHNFSFLIIIAAGMLVFRMHPSLFIKAVVMSALMIMFALEGINAYGMFTVIYFIFFCTGILILSRSYGL